MKWEANNLLISGPPGIGKTTLVQKVARQLTGWRITGFITEEVREGGKRIGFDLVSMTGERAVLSRTGLDTGHRVGRYGVDVDALESFLASFAGISTEYDLIIIDEIGKMECISGLFRELIADMLNNKVCMVATIALRGSHFIEQIKVRSDVTLCEISRENRDILPEQILAGIRDCHDRSRTRSR